MSKSKKAALQYATYTHVFQARTPRGNAIKKGTLLKTNSEGMLVLAKGYKDARFVAIEDRPKDSFTVVAGSLWE